jgi:ABC-type uncharacterized transport system involved in gliding motility auxiliary subunit
VKKSLLSITGILVIAGIVLFVNGLTKIWFSGARIDLTEEGLYSLSPGTKRILSDLERPITLRFYFSRTDASQYSGIRLYGDRIKNLLDEYVSKSGGKIRLEIEDPRPDTEQEEWAQKYGLKPIPTQAGQGLYFGLVAITGVGQEMVIPVFDFQRQELLEYDITKLIYSLSQSTKPTIGIISSLNLQGGPPQMPTSPFQQQPAIEPWFIISQLEELYTVRHIETSVSDIPDELSMLVVIHPKEFSESLLYAIDQYVLRGGRLFVAVDPFCQSDEPAPNPASPAQAFMADRSSNLEKLFNNWGIEQIEKKVVGDRTLSTRVNTGQGQAPANFLLWLSLQKANMNQSSIVTSGLDNMVMPWAGAFRIKEQDGVESEILLSTTSESMLYDENDYRFGGGEPEGLLRKFRATGTNYPLAVQLQGTFKTNFPNGPPDGVGGTREHLSESSDTGTIVAISDVDVFSDRFSVLSQNFLGMRLVRPLNHNLIFFMNVVENLTGSDDLIGLRSRGTFSRPFTKVQQIEQNAQDRWRDEEAVYQARLNAANQRLSQLQRDGTDDAMGQVFGANVMEELRKLREERQEIQRNLRKVRRNLREDIERLGTNLFLLNTFFVPLCLIVISILLAQMRKKKLKQQS